MHPNVLRPGGIDLGQLLSIPCFFVIEAPSYFNVMTFSPQNFSAAIIDLDGTLVDTLGDFVVALQRMLHDLPPPFADYIVERDVVERLIGRGSEHLIKSLLAHVDASPVATQSIAVYEKAWQSYQLHYRAINGRFARVYPGAVQGLTQLQSMGLRLACVTNKPTAFARDLLRIKGLDGLFEVTLGGDAVERKKPDPMPLLKACELLGSLPERTLMVGDSSNDALAARAAGCPVLLVTYGYNHGQPVHAVDADAFADSLAEIPWAD
jgi:phosphoglycolate phosphatase